MNKPVPSVPSVVKKIAFQTTDITDDTDRIANANSGENSMGSLIHKELSESLIGCAMTVLNTLRPGLDEKLYENALVIELRKRGHQAQQQVQFPVHYDGQLIGTLVPDLIVDELVIVDPKVVSAFNDNHMAQMLGYLNITNLELAPLLNFKNAKLEWKRVVR